MESEQLIRGKVPLRATGSNDETSLHESAKELELHRHLNATTDVENFIFRTRHCLLKIGITDFSHLNCNSAIDSLDPFSTHDPRVTEQYANEGFHQDDLATRHLLTNDTPIFRSTVCKYIDAAPFDNDMFRRHRVATQFMNKQGPG